MNVVTTEDIWKLYAMLIFNLPERYEYENSSKVFKQYSSDYTTDASSNGFYSFSEETLIIRYIFYFVNISLEQE